MMLALFRLVEAAEGSIYIDGVDISKLGLEKLRSSLAIMPQVSIRIHHNVLTYSSDYYRME